MTYPSCLHWAEGGRLAHCTVIRRPSIIRPCLCRQPNSSIDVDVNAHIIVRILGIILPTKLDKSERLTG